MRDVLAVIGAIGVVCFVGFGLLCVWFWVRGWKAAPYVDEMQERRP